MLHILAQVPELMTEVLAGYAIDQLDPETFNRTLIRRVVRFHLFHVNHHRLTSASISKRAVQE